MNESSQVKWGEVSPKASNNNNPFGYLNQRQDSIDKTFFAAQATAPKPLDFTTDRNPAYLRANSRANNDNMDANLLSEHGSNDNHAKAIAVENA